MIKYGGMTKRGKVSFLIFENSRDERIEVPIDDRTAFRVTTYLEKIAEHNVKIIEKGNDEPSE